MTLKQKTEVWMAAIKAVHGSKFGVKVLVASDVAKALGLIFTFDGSGFELRRNNVQGNRLPGTLIAKADTNHTTLEWVKS